MLRHSSADNHPVSLQAVDDDDSRTGLLDMEARLNADEDGSFRASLLERLERCQADIRRVLGNGVPPDEFRQLNRVLEACEAAVAVLTTPSAH